MLQSKIKHFCALICHKQPQTAYSRFLWLCYCRRNHNGSVVVFWEMYFVLKQVYSFITVKTEWIQRTVLVRLSVFLKHVFRSLLFQPVETKNTAGSKVLFFCSGCNRLWFCNIKSINIDAMHFQLSTLYFVHLKEEFAYLH